MRVTDIGKNWITLEAPKQTFSDLLRILQNSPEVSYFDGSYYENKSLLEKLESQLEELLAKDENTFSMAVSRREITALFGYLSAAAIIDTEDVTLGLPEKDIEQLDEYISRIFYQINPSLFRKP